MQVARAQPAEGSVEDAGVQRWNDDGSADVLIAMKLTTTIAGRQRDRGKWLALR